MKEKQKKATFEFKNGYVVTYYEDHSVQGYYWKRELTVKISGKTYVKGGPEYTKSSPAYYESFEWMASIVLNPSKLLPL